MLVLLFPDKRLRGFRVDDRDDRSLDQDENEDGKVRDRRADVPSTAYPAAVREGSL
jgi:hypothetical protein